MAELCFLLFEILFNFLDNPSVSIRSCPVDLSGGGWEFPLVFQSFKFKLSSLGIYQPDLFPFFEENPPEFNIRLDGNSIIVNQIAFTDSPFIIIAIDNFLKESLGVHSGCRSQSNFYPIKMVQDLAPFTFFLSGISTVALIGNDDIERMVRNIQFRSIGIIILILRGRKHTLIPKQINPHTLDRRDINETVSAIWISQIFAWKNFRIKFYIFIQIFPLKSLAINFIALVEL